MVNVTDTTHLVPAIAGRRTRKSGPGRRRDRKITPWLFLLVPLALLAVFTYLPAANMFMYSFTSWNGFEATPKQFVGVDNYAAIFTRDDILPVFLVSVYYIGASFIQMALALYFATLLSFSTWFQNLFKGILFFPALINGVAIGFVFLYLFQPGGTLDSALGALGLGDLTRHWLGDPDVVNYSLAATSVWRYTGLNFVLFLGAIQSIPKETYEAAEIDGANRWHQFRYIIAPSIKRIISLSFILAISGSLAVFEIPYIMTQGANGSMTFVIKTVTLGLGTFHKVGLASAMAVVLLLIVLIITWVQRRLVPDDKVDLS
jgi:raffinose/stachyose/melibiose transport system permease protein